MYYCVYNAQRNELYITTINDDIYFLSFIKNDLCEILITHNMNEVKEFSDKNLKDPQIIIDSIYGSLNDCQKNALTEIDNGANIFITGSPGTGKSYLITSICKLLAYRNKEYGLTATTGCAAYNIQGTTIHSLFGMNIYSDNFEEHYQFLLRKRTPLFKKIKNLDVLIIEEISMLNDVLYIFLDSLLKLIKNTDKPFGGIQLIFVGDFYQLPPINGKYCFTCDKWKESNLKIITLQIVIRQKDDQLFQYILQRIQKGNISSKIISYLEELKKTTFKNNIQPTKLYPINIDVNKINAKEISKLEDGRIFIEYNAKSNCDVKKEIYTIRMCQDAQIMVTRNVDIPNGIVNGTRGIILAVFEEYITILTNDNKTVNIGYYQEFLDNMKRKSITFMPIKLAYALSIHKSQGMTIDCIEIDLGNNIFEYGQAYTAISRARCLKNIKIINISKASFKTNKIVDIFYQNNK
jgi:ATP-dependent exoDNAse (exonuclease V) alpha subunit